MHKDNQPFPEPKGTYRVRNWRQYNAGHNYTGRGHDVDRRESTVGTSADTSQRGRPRLYADALIQGLLVLKQMFRLPLRALQGFSQSLASLAFPDLPVPNYTTLSRRAQCLDVVLPIPQSSAPLDLVVDSKGLKLYGEGEWKVRKHGWAKRRTWRKVHLAMKANTGLIHAALMAHQDVGDSEVLPELLEQIPPEVRIASVGADGAYDTMDCHSLIAEHGAQPSIPPRQGAAPWKSDIPVAGVNEKRPAAITNAPWSRI